MINTIKKLTSELRKEKYDLTGAKVLVRDAEGKEYIIDRMRLVTMYGKESPDRLVIEVIESNG